MARGLLPTATRRFGQPAFVTRRPVVDRDGRARDVGSWHADPARRALLERYRQVRLDTLPPASPVALALSAGTPVTESVAEVLGMMPPGPAQDPETPPHDG